MAPDLRTKVDANRAARLAQEREMEQRMKAETKVRRHACTRCSPPFSDLCRPSLCGQTNEHINSMDGRRFRPGSCTWLAPVMT